MTSISHVTLEMPNPSAAEWFYLTAFGPDIPVRTQASEAPSNGFRGFALGLDLAGPAGVDAVFARALAAGGIEVRPPRKQFWGGYSGVVQDPEGVVWKFATPAKQDDARVDVAMERIVLLLGVTDVRASKRFYVDQGLSVAKSYGGKYVEFAPGAGAVTLGLYKRDGLAKEFGVPADGTGSHRLVIGCDARPFTDSDEFTWQSVGAVEG